MKTETFKSESVRIPEPREGVATHVNRYKETKAVILHPSDFARFATIESILGDVSMPDKFPFSDAAKAAHIDSVTPSGDPVTDPDELHRLFS